MTFQKLYFPMNVILLLNLVNCVEEVILQSYKMKILVNYLSFQTFQ